MNKLVFQNLHMGTYGLFTLCENILILQIRIKDKGRVQPTTPCKENVMKSKLLLSKMIVPKACR